MSVRVTPDPINSTFYKYEPFFYRFEPSATSFFGTNAFNGSSFELKNGYLRVDNSSNAYFDASAGGFQFSSDAPLNLVVTDLAGKSISTSIRVNPGRFYSIIDNTQYTLGQYKQVSINLDTCVNISADSLASIPSLPVGLGISGSGRHWAITGNPSLITTNRTYTLFGRDLTTGQVVTSKLQMSVVAPSIVISNVHNDNLVINSYTNLFFTIDCPHDVGGIIMKYGNLPTGVYLSNDDTGQRISTNPYIFSGLAEDAPANVSSYNLISPSTAHFFRQQGDSNYIVPVTVQAIKYGYTIATTTYNVKFVMNPSTLFITSDGEPAESYTFPRTVYQGSTANLSNFYIDANVYFSNNPVTPNVTSSVISSGIDVSAIPGKSNRIAFKVGTITSASNARIRLIETNTGNEAYISFPVDPNPTTITGPTEQFTLIRYRDLSNLSSNIQITAHRTSGESVPVTVVSNDLDSTGLSLDSNGILRGYPTTVTDGFVTARFTASAYPNTTAPTYTLNYRVLDEVITLTCDLEGTLYGSQNIPFTAFRVHATSFSGRPIISYYSPDAPIGVNVSSSGVVSGTPLVSGSGTFSIYASTGYSSTSIQIPYSFTSDEILFVIPTSKANCLPNVPIDPIEIPGFVYSGREIDSFTSDLSFGLSITTDGFITGTLTSNIWPATNNFIITAYAGLLDGSSDVILNVSNAPDLRAFMLTSGPKTSSLMNREGWGYGGPSNSNTWNPVSNYQNNLYSLSNRGTTFIATGDYGIRSNERNSNVTLCNGKELVDFTTYNLYLPVTATSDVSLNIPFRAPLRSLNANFTNFSTNHTIKLYDASAQTLLMNIPPSTFGFFNSTLDNYSVRTDTSGILAKTNILRSTSVSNWTAVSNNYWSVTSIANVEGQSQWLGIETMYMNDPLADIKDFRKMQIIFSSNDGSSWITKSVFDSNSTIAPYQTTQSVLFQNITLPFGGKMTYANDGTWLMGCGMDISADQVANPSLETMHYSIDYGTSWNRISNSFTKYTFDFAGYSSNWVAVGTDVDEFTCGNQVLVGTTRNTSSTVVPSHVINGTRNGLDWIPAMEDTTNSTYLPNNVNAIATDMNDTWLAVGSRVNGVNNMNTAIMYSTPGPDDQLAGYNWQGITFIHNGLPTTLTGTFNDTVYIGSNSWVAVGESNVMSPGIVYGTVDNFKSAVITDTNGTGYNVGNVICVSYDPSTKTIIAGSVNRVSLSSSVGDRWDISQNLLPLIPYACKVYTDSTNHTISVYVGAPESEQAPIVFSRGTATWIPTQGTANAGIIRDIDYNGSRWVAVGDGVILTCETLDGIWSNVTPAGMNTPRNAVRWAGSYWITGGASDYFVSPHYYYSEDGINWKPQPYQTLHSTVTVNAIAVGRMLGSSSKPSIKYSTDVTNVWTDVQTGTLGRHVKYANGMWLMTGYDYVASNGTRPLTMKYSYDGQNWSNIIWDSNYRYKFGNTDEVTVVYASSSNWMISVREANRFTPNVITTSIYYHDFTSPIASNWSKADISYLSNPYINAFYGPEFLFYNGTPSMELLFENALGNGPTFVSPVNRTIKCYQFAEMDTVLIRATGGVGTIRYFTDYIKLPPGISFEPLRDAAGVSTGAILYGVCRQLLDSYPIVIYARDSVGTSVMTLSLTTQIPRIVKKQPNASAYTNLLKKYTQVNASVNAINNIVYPSGLVLQGAFMDGAAPDVITQTICEPKRFYG